MVEGEEDEAEEEIEEEVEEEEDMQEMGDDEDVGMEDEDQEEVKVILQKDAKIHAGSVIKKCMISDFLSKLEPRLFL